VTRQPSARKRGDRRLDDLDLLAAEQAAFAGMRIEPGNRQPRLGDSEIALEPAQRRPPARFDQAGGERAGTSASGTWVVTGTVRSVGPASIIATLPGRSRSVRRRTRSARVPEADRIKLLLGPGR
jgi:hypothetical protein